jgi:serine/threonine protein kinase
MSDFRIGDFQVIGTLGTGAHSTILQVRRAADSKLYALKVVQIDSSEDKKFFDQAEHEFEVAGKLNHANLLRFYAFETVKDWLWRVKKVHLLSEYVNGKTLDQCPRLTMPRLLQIFRAVSDGMVHMHRRQVCHGDLKPNNIMLSKTGEVKIIDFGLARLKDEVVSRIQGTPEYIAPEQFKHKMINERTDIYNLGATMYRLASFQLPPPVFSEEDGNVALDAKMFARLYKPVEELSPKMPPEFAKLINQCLSYEANKRPERMSEIQGTLDRLCDKYVGADDGLENIAL